MNDDLLAAVPPLPEPAPAPPTDQVAQLNSSATSPPRLLLLGPVQLVGAAGVVEPTRRSRLTELAAILAANPGCDYTTIDACSYPGQRVLDNTRNTQMSKLRRWLGKSPEGEDYLPRYQGGAGYQLHPSVSTDWDQWNDLLPDGPNRASLEDLEAALKLVRGRPFEGTRSRRYAWAETLKQTMITAIANVAYELARRHLVQGHWREAEAAVVAGLAIEPGMERLWRVRILSAYGAGNRQAVQEAVDRLLAIAGQLGGGLEETTEELLEQLMVKAGLKR